MKMVLVIEDETQTRNIFLQCLEFEGFRAFGASDGTTGMKLAKNHHLLTPGSLCDIMMPDMDGCAVLSSLRRSTENCRHSPDFFLTAKGHHD